jgi:hypothetical protein
VAEVSEEAEAARSGTTDEETEQALMRVKPRVSEIDGGLHFHISPEDGSDQALCELLNANRKAGMELRLLGGPGRKITVTSGEWTGFTIGYALPDKAKPLHDDVSIGSIEQAEIEIPAGVALQSMAHPGSEPPEAWEYKIVPLPFHPNNFNDLGAEGWELVCSTGVRTVAGSGDLIFIFKRRKIL